MRTHYSLADSETRKHRFAASDEAPSVVLPQQRISVFLTTNHPESAEERSGEVARIFTEFHGRTILIDLNEVTNMDSWGIALFMEAMQRISAYGGNLVLFGIGEELRRLFHTAKLDQFFAICSTREEALSREHAADGPLDGTYDSRAAYVLQDAAPAAL